MDTYTIKLTLAQVNEIVACMREGPYGKVNSIIQELARQIREQRAAGNGRDDEKDIAPQPPN